MEFIECGTIIHCDNEKCDGAGLASSERTLLIYREFNKSIYIRLYKLWTRQRYFKVFCAALSFSLFPSRGSPLPVHSQAF